MNKVKEKIKKWCSENKKIRELHKIKEVGWNELDNIGAAENEYFIDEANMRIRLRVLSNPNPNWFEDKNAPDTGIIFYAVRKQNEGMR